MPQSSLARTEASALPSHEYDQYLHHDEDELSHAQNHSKEYPKGMLLTQKQQTKKNL